jgi:hypothetical protein
VLYGAEQDNFGTFRAHSLKIWRWMDSRCHRVFIWARIIMRYGRFLVKVSDYFAEMYVAGRFADAGWNVYFPRRDQGFDFIVSRPTPDGMQLLRPVQVKGKYPTTDKVDKATYGYIGDLSQLHPEMVLAIPFFSPASPGVPTFVAYLPFPLIRKQVSKGFACQPAKFCDGAVAPRRDYARFFDEAGLKLVEQLDWARLTVENATIVGSDHH